YHFEGDHVENITGGSARIQANIVSGLDAQVSVTSDSFYDTRAFVGVSWTFGPLRRSELKQDTALGRIGEHVSRNYTVVAPKQKWVEHDVLAMDPETDNPYRVAHVSSAAAPGGSGTVSSPFQTILEAQAAGKDLIFVHAGSL